MLLAPAVMFLFVPFLGVVLPAAGARARDVIGLTLARGEQIIPIIGATVDAFWLVGLAIFAANIRQTLRRPSDS
jgi:hypothetical protein